MTKEEFLQLQKKYAVQIDEIRQSAHALHQRKDLEVFKRTYGITGNIEKFY